MSSVKSYQNTTTLVADTTEIPVVYTKIWVADTTNQVVDTTAAPVADAISCYPNWCRRCSLMDQMRPLQTYGNRTRVCLGPYMNTLELSRASHHTESTTHLAILVSDALRFALTLHKSYGLNATSLFCRFTVESPSGLNPELMEHLCCWLGFESRPRAPDQISTLDQLIQLVGPQPGGLMSFYHKDLAQGPNDSETAVRRLPFVQRYLDPNELNNVILQVFAEASGVSFTFGKHGLSIFIGLQNGQPYEMTLVAHRLGR